MRATHQCVVSNAEPRASDRHLQSYDVSLEVEIENYQNYSALCCARQLYIMISTHVITHKSRFVVHFGQAQGRESLPARDRRSTTVPHIQYTL